MSEYRWLYQLTEYGEIYYALDDNHDESKFTHFIEIQALKDLQEQCDLLEEALDKIFKYQNIDTYVEALAGNALEDFQQFKEKVR